MVRVQFFSKKMKLALLKAQKAEDKSMNIQSSIDIFEERQSEALLVLQEDLNNLYRRMNFLEGRVRVLEEKENG